MSKEKKTNKALVAVLAVVAVAIIGGLIIVINKTNDNNSQSPNKEVTAEDLIRETNLQHEDAIAGQIKAKADLFYANNDYYPLNLEDFAEAPESLKDFSYQSDGKQYRITYTSSVDGKMKIKTEKSPYQFLSNEKYKGEALLQKTYTTDYLTKKVRKNNGEVRQFLVKNSHEAIIEPEVFDRVQELLIKNKKRRPKAYKDYPFTGKIICGDCGSFYGRDIWRVRSTGEKYPIWYCNHKYDGDEVCKTEPLREEKIKAAFETMQEKRGETDVAYSNERWKEVVRSLTAYRDGRLVFLLVDGNEIQI